MPPRPAVRRPGAAAGRRRAGRLGTMDQHSAHGPRHGTPPDNAPRHDRDHGTWTTIDELHNWLDSETGIPPEQDLLLRMLKLSEEVGEVARAVIGATGQNPRKGATHSWQDVETELCDVIVTAMVALRTLTPDAAAVFDGHVRRVAARPRSPLGPSRQAPGTTP
ncbi:MazG-like family protein [Streptomyces sp. NPDC006510]|uniref:MazG-like family protein n=1 Tax=Streptomyces sp. NPDC006510 TaxID=3155600 RepID=UPI0033B5374D